MPHQTGTNEDWWVDDQTPDNPFGKSEDYEAYFDHLGALPRSFSPEIAAEPIVINVTELNNYPEYQAAAIGALQMWSAVTPLEFEIIDDAPFDPAVHWMQIVNSEPGGESDSIAFSNKDHGHIGQQLCDTKVNLNDSADHVCCSCDQEFGVERPRPGSAASHRKTVRQSSVPMGALAFIDRKRGQWRILAQRKIGGPLWICTMLRLAAVIAEKLTIPNALDGASERNFFPAGGANSVIPGITRKVI